MRTGMPAAARLQGPSSEAAGRTRPPIGTGKHDLDGSGDHKETEYVDFA